MYMEMETGHQSSKNLIQPDKLLNQTYGMAALVIFLFILTKACWQKKSHTRDMINTQRRNTNTILPDK